MARLEQQSFGMLSSIAPTITWRDTTLAPSLAGSNTVDDTESIMTVRGPITDAQKAQSSDQRQMFGYSFDQDLNTSRPYTRALQKHQVWSTTSSEIHTMGWSCLSGLSLAEISHISVINLPLCPQDLWNGHHYSEIKIDRDGLILSKCWSPLKAAPTSKRRLNTGVSLHSGNMSETLSSIKEDKAVPVAARTMLLIGMFPLRLMKGSCCGSRIVNYGNLLGESLSGKTTVYNHLQILYGNGITELERLTAFDFIIRNLVDILVDAVSVWSDIYDHDWPFTDVKVRSPVTHDVLCQIIADGAQSPSIYGH